MIFFNHTKTNMNLDDRATLDNEESLTRIRITNSPILTLNINIRKVCATVKKINTT